MKTLAPWSTIIRLPEYHGALDDQQIQKILENEPIGSYILTNYNGKDTDDECFNITIKWSHYKRKINLHLNGSLTTPTAINCICEYHEEAKYHSREWFGGKIQLEKVTNRQPFPLSHWCRAVLCKTQDYNKVFYKYQSKAIPKAIFLFLTEGSQETTIRVPTNPKRIFETRDFPAIRHYVGRNPRCVFKALTKEFKLRKDYDQFMKGREKRRPPKNKNNTSTF